MPDDATPNGGGLAPALAGAAPGLGVVQRSREVFPDAGRLADGVEGHGGGPAVEAPVLGSARALAPGARASWVVTLALPALVLAMCGWSRRWVGDDGFINVRVAEQLLRGNGMVFNAGERSEAITSPAWVVLLSAAGGLGVRLDDAAWALSLGLAVAGIWWSGSASLQRRAADASGKAVWCLPVGLLCYACLPPAWDYATSGLENGLGLAFLGASYWAVARSRATQPRAGGGFSAAAWLLGFAPLVRPDYVLLSLPLVALLCWRARTLRSRAGILSAALAPGTIYQVFRMGYFASLVPNTALAKEAFGSRWDQGWHYFYNSVGLYWVAAPVLCVLVVIALRARVERDANVFALTLAASGVLHLSYVARVGGDFMHGRMLLPGLFAVLSAAPLVTFEARASRAVRWVGGCACAVAWAWCLLCGLRLRVAADNEFGIGDERGWYARLSGDEHPTRIEHYRDMPFYQLARRVEKQVPHHCEGDTGNDLAACAPVLVTSGQDGRLRDHPGSAVLPLEQGVVPEGIDAVVALRPLGISSGVLGPRVNLVDYFGLADPVASRLSMSKRGRPGHEKAFSTVWLSAKYAAAGSTTDSRVRAARRALDCGLLRELRHATTDRLDVSRFIRNVRLSFALSALRIPADPRAARQQLCQ
jgi:arabinofuranosyltransferase